jgi:hypothetical protein
MKAIRFFCIGIATLYLILLSAEQDFATGAEYPMIPINIIVGPLVNRYDAKFRSEHVFFSNAIKGLTK